MKELLNKTVALYKKFSDVITPTAVLTIICIVVTLALSSANALTHAKIESLAIETKNAAMANLIAADEYHELNAITTKGDITYNAAIKDGETIGCIFTVETKGYGGTVSVMTAVNMDGTVAAIEILDAANETPGLGQNVTKPDWFSQFAGLTKDISVIKGGTANHDKNEVNAVTGATISSRAVTEAVNTALSYAEEIIVSNAHVKEDVPVE